MYRGDIDTPKTVKSVRKVALPEGLRQDLKTWLATSPDSGPDGWLFPSEKLTTPLAKDNAWRRHIGPRLDAIGLGWVNFHILRRSHSSLMRDRNVDPKVVADQQGHTLDVNLNVYTETTLERQNRSRSTAPKLKRRSSYTSRECPSIRSLLFSLKMPQRCGFPSSKPKHLIQVPSLKRT